MTDDIVTRLRDLREMLMGNPSMARDAHEAANEIERLRQALALAVGELSTHAQYQYLHPEQLLNEFLTKAVRGD